MTDFKERLEAAVLRGLYFHHEKDATVRVTVIKDRYPFPVDDQVARACSGVTKVFSDHYKGRTYCAVEVFFSEEYKQLYDTKELVHPIAHTCNVIFRTLNLGSSTIGDCSWDRDKLKFPVQVTEETYTHLPPLKGV